MPRDINCIVLPDNGVVEWAAEKPISAADDEHDTVHANPVNLDLIGLEKIAQEIAANARSAFKSAENYPEGSHGRRFIEHGAVCYFNSYAALRRFIDAAAKSKQQSA